ncbi:hypothetical protein BU24DRAFT_467911 [Aaosphaeria arxii CBS 175.79]|uniref:Uncharacterized protein n=1 Tax=Aaosphaeria arxii CBS 175.79 TaxID=1450172 RepID=A0A6A5X9U8_9PLEO|nr:uncharacterized protein BU24DRAFT_467911 [Aaosphaeria arxii CBS 175.79]KAF2009547.1 hypothetical protein BU24DRAFT_467911 [Aaosphaeria arxii CBS 175.79]
MSNICTLDGNADLYGRGVRVGYYLQWYAGILATWICPSEVPKIRIANTFFTSAVFIALLVQISRSTTFEVIDIYITMLFTFGWAVTGLVVLLWRIATGFDVRWDPSLYHRNKLTTGHLFQSYYPLFLNVVFVFQIWFWTTKLGATDLQDCPRNGFLFVKIALNNRWFRALNASIYVLLLALTTLFLVANFKPIAAVGGSGIYNRLTQTRSVSASLAMSYYIFNTLADLFVATTILIGTELSIRWNNITGVSSITSPGQLIPLLIGIACAIRVLYGGGRRLFNKTRLTIPGVLGPSTHDPDENMQDQTNGPPGSHNDEPAPLELTAASTPLQGPDIALQHLEFPQLLLNSFGPPPTALQDPDIPTQHLEFPQEPPTALQDPDIPMQHLEFPQEPSDFYNLFTPHPSSQSVPRTVRRATSTSTSISPTSQQQPSLTPRTSKKVTVIGSYGGGNSVYYGGGGGGGPRDGG